MYMIYIQGMYVYKYSRYIVYFQPSAQDRKAINAACQQLWHVRTFVCMYVRIQWNNIETCLYSDNSVAITTVGYTIDKMPKISS